jgi:hypothetical protein
VIDNRITPVRHKRRLFKKELPDALAGKATAANIRDGLLELLAQGMTEKFVASNAQRLKFTTGIRLLTG